MSDPQAPPAGHELKLWRPRNIGRLLRHGLGNLRSEDPENARMTQRMANAERRGLELVILCRTLMFAAGLVFYVVSLLLSNSRPTPQGIAFLSGMTAIGIVYFVAIGSRYERKWFKYVLVTVDIATLCGLVAFARVAPDVPQILVFRTFGIALLFPMIALAALSFSPRLVLWAGFAAVAFWWAAFLLVVSGMEETVSFSDIPMDAAGEAYTAVLLAPNFIGTGTRMVETLITAVVTGVLALAVARARRLFFAQVRAEMQREAERDKRSRITRQLGRYVPEVIAERLIRNPAGFAPKVYHGAVLILDIEGFTSWAEARSPDEVIGTLNDFLARCADEVGETDGVVIAFTGDGLLATFNSPVEVDEPEAKALEAAERLLVCGREYGFRLRIGIAGGELAAGSVGSRKRQAFTVYGDTVNRAARLEALAKEARVSLLVDDVIRAATDEPFVKLGSHVLRGMHTPTVVWARKGELGEEAASASTDS